MFRRGTNEMRVLISTPVGRDATLVAQTLGAIGVESAIVPDTDALVNEVQHGAGASIISDEALSPRHIDELTSWLSGEPPWSDPPFIILTAGGRVSTTAMNALDSFRH